MWICTAGETASSQVLQGSSFRLNCSASPPGCATVGRSTAATWYFIGEVDERRPDEPAVSTVTLLTSHDVDPSSQYLTTRSNELVVLSANISHSGTYTCLIDGRTVARHHVRVLRTLLLLLLLSLWRVWPKRKIVLDEKITTPWATKNLPL